MPREVLRIPGVHHVGDEDFDLWDSVRRERLHSCRHRLNVVGLAGVMLSVMLLSISFGIISPDAILMRYVPQTRPKSQTQVEMLEMGYLGASWTSYNFDDDKPVLKSYSLEAISCSSDVLVAVMYAGGVVWLIALALLFLVQVWEMLQPLTEEEKQAAILKLAADCRALGVASGDIGGHEASEEEMTAITADFNDDETANRAAGEAEDATERQTAPQRSLCGRGWVSMRRWWLTTKTCVTISQGTRHQFGRPVFFIVALFSAGFHFGCLFAIRHRVQVGNNVRHKDGQICAQCTDKDLPASERCGDDIDYNAIPWTTVGLLTIFAVLVMLLSQAIIVVDQVLTGMQKRERARRVSDSRGANAREALKRRREHVDAAASDAAVNVAY